MQKWTIRLGVLLSCMLTNLPDQTHPDTNVKTRALKIKVIIKHKLIEYRQETSVGVEVMFLCEKME